jgi:hypothetical protein
METKNTFGIISVISGILGFFIGRIFFGIFILPLIFGLVAIIFGLIGIKQDRDNTLAKIGVIIGIAVLIVTFTAIYIWIVWRFSNPREHPRTFLKNFFIKTFLYV